MASGVTLDEVVFWTPPVTASMECTGQTKQKRSISTSRIARELSCRRIDGKRNCVPATRTQTPEAPILISSDTESDVADPDGDRDDSDDCQNADDSRSDDTLPSVRTLLATAKASPRSANSTDNPNRGVEDANSTGHARRQGSLADDSVLAEATTIPESSNPIRGSTSPSPASISTSPRGAQSRAEQAFQGHTEGVLYEVDPASRYGATTQSCHVDDAPEDCTFARLGSTPSEGQDAEMSDCQPGVAETDSRQYTTTPRLRAQASHGPGSTHCNDGDERDQEMDGKSGRFQCEQDSSVDVSDSGVHHVEYPSPPDINPGGQQGDDSTNDPDNDDDVEQHPHKRRRLGRSATTAERHRHSSTIANTTNASSVSTLSEKHTPERSMPSPPLSCTSSQDEDAGVAVAKFDEWPLENAMLKRVLVNGRATFQLQFEWDSCIQHSLRGRTQRNKPRASMAKGPGQARRKPGVRGSFTPDEDNLLIELKEGDEKRPWSEIHQHFSDKFPGRSRGALQVHYCTKLRHREEAVAAGTSDPLQVLSETADIASPADAPTPHEEHDSLRRASTGRCSPSNMRRHDVPMELIDPQLRSDETFGD